MHSFFFGFVSHREPVGFPFFSTISTPNSILATYLVTSKRFSPSLPPGLMCCLDLSHCKKPSPLLQFITAISHALFSCSLHGLVKLVRLLSSLSCTKFEKRKDYLWITLGTTHTAGKIEKKLLFSCFGQLHACITWIRQSFPFDFCSQ